MPIHTPRVVSLTMENPRGDFLETLAREKMETG